MSNLAVNTITNAAGGNTAQINGMTPTAQSLQGFRNRLINGGMAIAQRATSATVTAGTGVPTASTGYPSVDRFFVYSTGANVTAARVAGSDNTQFRLQITGASSVTAVGVGQRIEQSNSFDLAGGTATLSVDLANSLLTTVTWTASYATTADTFGTIGTPTKTQIATGTFTVNSTVSRYNATFSVPSAATTGIEILLTVGAQTSGTLTVGSIQLEAGSVATPFERRDYGRELIMCQRYYQKIGGTGAEIYAAGYITSSGFLTFPITFPTMRVAPTGTIAGTWGVSNVAQPVLSATSPSAVSILASGTAIGQGQFSSINATTFITFAAEL
jgi:hypothetical protein